MNIEEPVCVSKPEHLLTGDDQRYHLYQDVARRFLHTLIRFEGELVYVRDTTTELWLHVESSSKKMFYVSANDRRLDISSIRLGYINYGNTAVYTTRQPWRQQQQGVNPGRVQAFFPAGHPFPLKTEPTIKALRDQDEGKYPRLSSFDGANSFAVSRTWAVVPLSSKMGLLYHRETLVGIYKPQEFRFSLRKDTFTHRRLASLQDVLSKQEGVSYAIQT